LDKLFYIAEALYDAATNRLVILKLFFSIFLFVFICCCRYPGIEQ